MWECGNNWPCLDLVGFLRAVKSLQNFVAVSVRQLTISCLTFRADSRRPVLFEWATSSVRHGKADDRREKPADRQDNANSRAG